MSHVKVSFEMSEYTAEADGVGVLRLLNAIRSAGLEKKTRLYQVMRRKGVMSAPPPPPSRPGFPIHFVPNYFSVRRLSTTTTLSLAASPFAINRVFVALMG